MAQVRVTYTWSEGASIESEVYTETNYPDALAQARAEAVRGLCETLAHVIGSGATGRVTCQCGDDRYHCPRCQRHWVVPGLAEMCRCDESASHSHEWTQATGT